MRPAQRHPSSPWQTGRSASTVHTPSTLPPLGSLSSMPKSQETCVCVPLNRKIISRLTISLQPVGIPGTPASRLVPAKNFATPESRKTLVDAIFQGLNQAHFKQILISSPYRYSKTHGGEDVSYTPAWRDTIWHVVTGFFWNYNTDVATVKKLYQASSAAIQPVRDLTPGSGAYHAEADVHEPDHEGETPSTATLS